MKFFPVIEKTIICENTQHEIIKRLYDLTSPPTRTQSKNNDLFVGTMGEDSFTVSKKIRSPQNFLPLIKGSIEGTGKGCIIHLKYQLFFSSFLFLSFWSIICLVMMVLFFFTYEEYIYGTLVFAAGTMNYLVSFVNFNKQVAKSHEMLIEALNMPI